ncbi:hypothetical protein KG088_11495 [Halomonas sp. TRM85114]|uniref:CsgE family curli-type amyloid fiber assembly protein n=1 Tax=Halomonas jincaotanensis TaxID=2810616 RepID=UPI001BD230B7|nr:CsgE family curli-type amyloid fiber assembly protein [Halomonas jincaotanensis]MBS9404256.1 hypothetical protein [Halomonas jincaotanensis]
MQPRIHSVETFALLCILTIPLAIATSAYAQVELDPGGLIQEQEPIVEEESIVEEEQEGIVEKPGQAEEELDRQFSLGEPGIQGVLIDRTVTMTGKTFFRQFGKLSLEHPVIREANLAIYERPSARWGSQIWIMLDNKVIFEATMPPRLSDIDQYVKVAIEQVEEMVIRETILQALDNDPDLADQEI